MNRSLVRFLLLLVFSSSQILAQNNDRYIIDSLHQVIKTNHINDHSKVDTFLELSKYYIYKDLDSAESYAHKGLDLAAKTNYIKGQAVAYIRKCKISEFSQNIDEAIGYGNKAISLYDNLKKDRNYLVILNIQAYLFEKQTHYDKALELYLNGLKAARDQENEMFAS
jgi:tetratricopeptide (TPR) repeat protein